jgi:hypothetical protein
LGRGGGKWCRLISSPLKLVFSPLVVSSPVVALFTSVVSFRQATFELSSEVNSELKPFFGFLVDSGKLVQVRVIFLFDSEGKTVALVRERTVPTERLPLVGEISANFCG